MNRIFGAVIILLVLAGCSLGSSESEEQPHQRQTEVPAEATTASSSSGGASETGMTAREGTPVALVSNPDGGQEVIDSTGRVLFRGRSGWSYEWRQVNQEQLLIGVGDESEEGPFPLNEALHYDSGTGRMAPLDWVSVNGAERMVRGRVRVVTERT